MASTISHPRGGVIGLVRVAVVGDMPFASHLLSDLYS